MEILYELTFNGGKIFEEKNTLLPKDAPKADRFKWFIQFGDQKTELDFVRIEPPVQHLRQFKFCGLDVHLDMSELVLSVGEEQYQLVLTKKPP